MAIAQAVLEYLDNLSPRTLFATHYHELTALAGTAPGGLHNVRCLTIDVREHNNEIVFMHKIVAGVANRSYGIHVARMAGMPASVVSRAESVLAGLESGTPVVSSGAVDATPAAQPAVAPKRTQNRVSEAAPRAQSQLSLFGE